MKCPKCGYLGFETTERCRHCGYDFSLSVTADSLAELPLRLPDERESPLADLDLDRVIGEAEPHRARDAVAVAARPGDRERTQPADGRETPGLPLFARAARHDHGDAPAVPPPPARPPLAVRRSTPEVARRRTPRTFRREADGLDLQLEPSAESPVRAASDETVAAAEQRTPHIRRAAAAVVDLILLAAINGAVLYLTLAVAGLTATDIGILPPIPMLSFLLLLNGGYLVAFTAVNGQTIGKMLFGLRVIADDTRGIAIGGAVVRSAGVLLTLVTLGLPYLTVLVSRDGRALHDRLAGTRVVKLA
jgi:uncharacterized RDD family membrane protein YckC